MLPEDGERRTTGGSRAMLREILGTFFGVAPYVIAIVVWGANVNERLRVLELRSDHVEAAAIRADQAAATQRTELVGRLERIAGQIEVLQQTVARGSK